MNKKQSKEQKILNCQDIERLELDIKEQKILWQKRGNYLVHWMKS
jgi:hypothetical protein